MMVTLKLDVSQNCIFIYVEILIKFIEVIFLKEKWVTNLENKDK